MGLLFLGGCVDSFPLLSPLPLLPLFTERVPSRSRLFVRSKSPDEFFDLLSEPLLLALEIGGGDDRLDLPSLLFARERGGGDGRLLLLREVGGGDERFISRFASLLLARESGGGDESFLSLLLARESGGGDVRFEALRPLLFARDLGGGDECLKGVRPLLFARDLGLEGPLEASRPLLFARDFGGDERLVSSRPLLFARDFSLSLLDSRFAGRGTDLPLEPCCLAPLLFERDCFEMVGSLLFDEREFFGSAPLFLGPRLFERERFCFAFGASRPPRPRLFVERARSLERLGSGMTID